MKSKEEILNDKSLTLIACATELENNGYKTSTGRKYSDISVLREKRSLGIDTQTERSKNRALEEYAEVITVLGELPQEWSYAKMAKHLNKCGFKTRGGVEFGYKQVQRIIERLTQKKKEAEVDLTIRAQQTIKYIKEEKRRIKNELKEREGQGETFLAGRLSALEEIEKKLS